MRSGDRGHNNPLGYLTDNRFVFKRKGNTTLGGNGLTVAKGSGLGQNKSGMGSLPEAPTHKKQHSLAFPAYPQSELSPQPSGKQCWHSSSHRLLGSREFLKNPPPPHAPLSVRELISREQMLLYKPKKVFKKYIRHHGDESPSWKRQLLENVVEASRRIQMGETDETFKKNIPIVTDFFSILRKKVKKNRVIEEKYNQYKKKQEEDERTGEKSDMEKVDKETTHEESAKRKLSMEVTKRRNTLTLETEPSTRVSQRRGSTIGRNSTNSNPVVGLLSDRSHKPNTFSKQEIDATSPEESPNLKPCLADRITAENKFTFQIKMVMKMLNDEKGKPLHERKLLTSTVSNPAVLQVDSTPLANSKKRMDNRRLKEKVGKIEFEKTASAAKVQKAKPKEQPLPQKKYKPFRIKLKKSVSMSKVPLVPRLYDIFDLNKQSRELQIEGADNLRILRAEAHKEVVCQMVDFEDTTLNPKDTPDPVSLFQDLGQIRDFDVQDLIRVYQSESSYRHLVNNSQVSQNLQDRYARIHSRTQSLSLIQTTQTLAMQSSPQPPSIPVKEDSTDNIPDDSASGDEGEIDKIFKRLRRYNMRIELIHLDYSKEKREELAKLERKKERAEKRIRKILMQWNEE